MSETSSLVERRYVAALLVLTAGTGAMDGVSFVALDRVFTGNMTGNVLFIGFGLVGVEGIPALNNAVALTAFAIGAVAAARINRGARSGPLLPISSLVVIATGISLTLACTVIWLSLGAIDDRLMLVFTAVLATTLGAQAAAVKSIGMRDLSTIVVTMTTVNLATDSRLAGGRGQAWKRRIGAIITMAVGGSLSAALALWFGGQWALLAAVVLMILGGVLLAFARVFDAKQTGSV